MIYITLHVNDIHTMWFTLGCKVPRKSHLLAVYASKSLFERIYYWFSAYSWGSRLIVVSYLQPYTSRLKTVSESTSDMHHILCKLQTYYVRHHTMCKWNRSRPNIEVLDPVQMGLPGTLTHRHFGQFRRSFDAGSKKKLPR